MVKVLFIAGWLRSGTTVTGNVLGSAPKALHVGELNYLWMKRHPAGFECGCGEVLFECPLWRPVLERLGMSDGRRYEVKQLRRESWRNNDTRARYRDWRLSRDDLAYPRVLSEVYRALADESGATLVIDSTKNPSDALAAALAPDIDLYLLHEVRDPRAAAYSALHPKNHGTDATGDPLQRFSSSRNTAHWAVRNLRVERGAGRVVATNRYLRVRYEDLVAAPQAAFGRIADWVGLDPAELPFTDGSTIHMTRSHTVMGNPNRNSDGDVSLSLDTRWVHGLSGRDRWTATVVASPLLGHYGYRYRVLQPERAERTLIPPAAG